MSPLPSLALAPTAPPAAPRPLDDPLPPELSGRSQGWFTQYRRYPVFSLPWVRGRLRMTLAVLAAVLVVMGGSALSNPGELPWGGFAQITIELLLPTLVGPWLGWRVRRLGLPEAQERWALAAAIGGLVLAMIALHQFGAEPMKQWIAERTGQVDEKGQRRRIAVAIGITIARPDEPAPMSPVEHAGEGLPQPVRTANIVSVALLSFLLGGGLALRGWHRERGGLAALQRERELAKAQAARREAELRLSVLAAQVEPHFLFNTLAGVRSAIATDPGRASEMIDRLVDYLRAAIPRLRSDGGSAATVAGQLDLVQAYLGLMRARMPRLSFTIDAPAELLAAPCPPLMLISLAENAVKHGVEPKIGPVHVEVRAARGADGRLELSVADDGAGFAAAASGGGLGLANIRERLQQIHGSRASLVLKARPGGGVAATLTLPLEPH